MEREVHTVGGTTSSDPRNPPPGYAYGAGYRIAPRLILRGAAYVLLGRPRSLALDGAVAVRAMPAEPCVRGLEHLPSSERLVIVANHYERPGMWMAWPALHAGHIVRQHIGREVRWVAIQDWTGFSLWGIPIPRSWTRMLFQRAYRVYGILAMAPEDAPASARAASMRSALSALRGGAVLGIMPEGTVGSTPELLEARPGAGLFLVFLAAAGARVVPTGMYEEGGRMVLAFGPQVDLKPPDGIAREERDTWVRLRVMRAIRDLLPEALWGAYRE